MSDSCPTVRVASEAAPGGYVVINEADFDPEVHELYAGAPEGAADADALRARIERLGGKAHHKAGHDKLREALDALLDDDSDGISRRELNADLTKLEVEFDPDGDKAELLKLRDDALAAKGGA